MKGQIRNVEWWKRSWISNSISSRNSMPQGFKEWRRTFCILGQQVNRSSKDNTLAKATGLYKNISDGLVTSIRPEARWSYQDQIIMDRTGECCIILRRVLISGEMPIWPGASWFSTETYLSMTSIKIYEGTARRFPTSLFI